MARQGKREYVTFKSVRLPVYPHTDQRTEATRYRFAYPDDSVKGGWRYGTRSTRKDAREAAHSKAVEIANGFLDLSNLTQQQAKLCREFLSLKPTKDDLNALKERKNKSNITYKEVLRLFIEQLPSPPSRTHKSLIANLRRFKNQDSRIFDISRADMAEHLASCPSGSYRHLRSAFVTLFKWAAREGYAKLENGLTEAEKLRPPEKRVAKPVRYLSPEESEFLLKEVKAEFRPWLVLALFSGLRSEEISPASHTNKKPLMWSQIKDQHIDLRADQSKVRKRRLIPISKQLRAWLDYIGMKNTGAVCHEAPTKKETKRLGLEMDKKFNRNEGWYRNVLRHTFLTFSAAIRKDLPAIAFEAGTSVQKLNTNYVEATHKDEADKFTALIPSDVFRT